MYTNINNNGFHISSQFITIFLTYFLFANLFGKGLIAISVWGHINIY